MTDDDSMLDEFLDCTGRIRMFRLSAYAHGQFLEAAEQREDGKRGLRFSLPTGADGVPPWGRMRAALRTRLAQRDLARDPRSGRLEMLTKVVRAQIGFARDEDDGPPLLVDDLEMSWVDLGRLLASHEGCHLRIEIEDPSQTLE